MKFAKLLNESIDNQKKLKVNIGGFRYIIKNDGTYKKIGSELSKYDENHKIVGAVSDYGRGNRHITPNNIEISLKDIFNNPQILIDKYPIRKSYSKLQMWTGNTKSDARVLWVKEVKTDEKY